MVRCPRSHGKASKVTRQGRPRSHGETPRATLPGGPRRGRAQQSLFPHSTSSCPPRVPGQGLKTDLLINSPPQPGGAQGIHSASQARGPTGRWLSPSPRNAGSFTWAAPPSLGPKTQLQFVPHGMNRAGEVWVGGHEACREHRGEAGGTSQPGRAQGPPRASYFILREDGGGEGRDATPLEGRGLGWHRGGRARKCG